MSVLVDRNTKVVVQGITGSAGKFHAGQMKEYGTKIVAGVTPGKGGMTQDGIPVFDTMEEAVDEDGRGRFRRLRAGAVPRGLDPRGRRRGDPGLRGDHRRVPGLRHGARRSRRFRRGAARWC